ncbi:MAG TPA: GNAT family N-acetyltransferase, partial [Thermomicrobiales bacterium]|nr:GNAT family N-acetyltransferase [Thermomicrobiales bacterium]
MLQSPIAAEALGFTGDAEHGWRRIARGREWRFRPLRTLADLQPVEAIQRRVMGVSDIDLSPVSALIVVPETGGDVLGAFPVNVDTLAGVAIGWGGYVDGAPRLVSDLLAVDPAFRNLGLGAELKRLQAAHAASRGFREIVWTVDPLRAANARLNFEKLGAVARRYEIDRYGSGYGAGLYGGLPTDRLHLSWRLDA